jgi:Reverse transcriptase (RNA-dependent DNA polymerase)
MYSPAIEAKVHKEIDRMLDIGVIEKSKSAWMNPMVVVNKPDSSLRLCLDSRQINSVTVPDGYPIPNINRILSRIKSTKVLSTIDLKETYWQIGLDEESREKVAFMVPGKGLFQFRVSPYGLKNAAACLARLMDGFLFLDPNLVTKSSVRFVLW